MSDRRLFQISFWHRAIAWWLTTGCIALAPSGCASLKDSQQSIARNQAQDVGPVREKRNQEVASDFDRNRDSSQFEAAASCWQRGDIEGSKTMLTQLLERNPNYRRARFVLADIYLFNGDTKRATDQLRMLVETKPDDAVAHHALAQVLDASGQREEAITHYQRALQLEPANEVYALSYKGVTGTGPALTPPSDTVAAQSKPVATRPTKEHPGVMITDLQMPPTESRSKLAADRAAASANLAKSSRQIPPPATLDDWVRPIDLGGNSAEASANVPKKAIVAETNSAPPVIAGPVTSRRSPPAEAAAMDTMPENGPLLQPPTKAANSGAVTASYSAPPTKSADSQNQYNPLQLAVDSLAHGNSDAAIEAATMGLAQEGGPRAALYRVLGAAHYRKGDYQSAQTALAQALSLDKTDALSYFLMGSTLAKLGQSEMAARCYAEAARLDSRFGS